VANGNILKCAHVPAWLSCHGLPIQVPWSASTAPHKKSCVRSSVASALSHPKMPPLSAGRRGSGRAMASTLVWAWPYCPVSSSAAVSSSRRKASYALLPPGPLELVGSLGRGGWGTGQLSPQPAISLHRGWGCSLRVGPQKGTKCS
jgi:hypothetical protein